MVGITIAFSTSPSISAVILELPRTTGLELEIDGEDEKLRSLVIPSSRTQFVEQTDHSIELLVGFGESSYLFWTLLLSLKTLGGAVGYEIPDYARSRWSELSDLHAQVRYGAPEHEGLA